MSAYANTKDKELREEARLENRADRNFSFYGKGNFYGAIIGAVMSLFMIIMQSNVNFPEYNSQIVQFLFFIPILTYALYQYSHALRRKIVFQNGALFGLYISAIAAVTYIILNTVFYFLGFQNWQLFTMDASEGFGKFIVIQMTTLFTILVAGGLWSFVAMQFFKNPGHAPELTDVVAKEEAKEQRRKG